MSSCQVHGTHSPHVASTDRHHVWPQGEGGPDTAGNIVIVCPTGHRNLHELLDAYREANGKPSWDTLRHYGQAERDLAHRGWIGMTERIVV